MLDLRLFRERPDWVDEQLKKRGEPPVSSLILKLDEEARSVQTELEKLLAQRNECSKKVGQLKAQQKKEEASLLMKEVAQLKGQISKLEEKHKTLTDQLQAKLHFLPNMLDPEVPYGKGEEDNVVLEYWGKPKAIANPKDHVELGEALGMYHPSLASDISGARFTILTGPLARLERALGQFMIDMQTKEAGFEEVSVPVLVKDKALFGTAQLPKFEEDSFTTTDGRRLIPTSEVPLTNMGEGKIFDEAELPKRYTALTLCFRSEAGAAGKDTRGMIRQHQFSKVEMVVLSHPDRSKEEHEHMTRAARNILEKLELPYRLVNLCSGDIGFAAQKTYDIEVWIPSQNTYREISSCSNCGDFQARRMKARFKRTGAKKPEFIHTLNGSGLAVGRCLVAVLENYQQPDGSIEIPKILIPYMDGMDKIEIKNEKKS